MSHLYCPIVWNSSLDIEMLEEKVIMTVGLGAEGKQVGHWRMVKATLIPCAVLP